MYKHEKGSMMTTSLYLKQWGNSLGVRLPAAIARLAGFQVDQQVNIVVKGDAVIITPTPDKTLTLEERISRFNPKNHGGESMTTDTILGAEKW
jgi:antitoxin MazE